MTTRAAGIVSTFSQTRYAFGSHAACQEATLPHSKSSQRAKIGVRMPEFCNPDSRAALHGSMIPLGRTARILRATAGLLLATLAVAGVAGLAALILPIVVLRSALGDGGRRHRRVVMRAPETESLLPFPRPRAISPPAAT